MGEWGNSGWGGWGGCIGRARRHARGGGAPGQGPPVPLAAEPVPWDQAMA